MSTEAIPGIPTSDPGPQQDDEQGEATPQEQGALPPEDPDGEPGFA
ncbi:MAG: hypothetical protein JWM62_2090 [Frankiales bacterium]|jgi:hypothetical protein|nr:hypothetical protein [Frankiales bacterium]